MIEVKALVRAYDDFVAVDDLSFSIGKGEIVGLLGHNGAGKTTIMKMLSGYLEPDEGSIRIDGLDLASEAQAVKARLGYLPESLPLYPEMVVADYLDYAARLKGLHGETGRQEIRRVVRATDIGSKLLAPIGTLSRGQKQRVGVAQAILGRPRVLILDEPTNGLDPSQTQQMRQLIRDLAHEATVILSTHIMQEVEALCDRVLILRAGTLVVDSSLAVLRQSDHLVLTTDLKPAEVRGIVATLAGGGELAGFRPQGDLHRYRIRCRDGVAPRAVTTNLARAVLERQGALLELAEETRDLEALFREANGEEGLEHAA